MARFLLDNRLKNCWRALYVSNGYQEDIMSEKKKILVVGGGPGGYVAAIRAAQLGGEAGAH